MKNCKSTCPIDQTSEEEGERPRERLKMKLPQSD